MNDVMMMNAELNRIVTKRNYVIGMKGSSGGSPSSLGSMSPVTSPHRQGSSQHRNSIDAVFVDLDLSKAGDFGLQIGDVDLRALAKDRQKKDNHNMSNYITLFNKLGSCSQATAKVVWMGNLKVLWRCSESAKGMIRADI